MNLKATSGAAALALAAAFYMAPASAAPILCETITNNHMLVDSSFVQSCIDAGVGNIGQGGGNDVFLNANAGWTNVGAGSFTQNGNTGTFTLDSSLWNTNDSLAIGFKFGTGNQPDEWFVYLLQDLVSTGTWTFVNVFGTGGGLSHVVIYGGGDGTEVPEPAMLTLFGLGLLSLGFARRKKA